MKLALTLLVAAAIALAWVPWPNPAPVVAQPAAALPAAALPARADDDPLLAGHEWRQLLTFHLPDAMVRPPAGAAAMGAWASGFRVDRRTRGSAILTTLDRPAVALFVGWGLPDEFVNTAPGDLRAVYTELDGTRHVATFAGGGGNGLLFQSPDGVPLAKLARVDLLCPAHADWIAEP